jgi:branched-chain amino acid transport system permease protein
MTALVTWLRRLAERPVLLVALIGQVAFFAYTLFWGAKDFNQFVNFTVIGIAAGAVYAIAAGGLVLTYATTGVFNFAHGAVGMLSAYIFFSLTQQAGLPTLLGLVVVLAVVAPLMGLAIELVMRRFKDASVTTTIVVTIALLVLLIGVAQSQYPPSESFVLPPLFGSDRFIDLGPARITWDQAAHIVVAIGVAIALRVLLFGSRTGTAMRAVVDNPTLAALNGAQPVAIARYSWMLGSMLAALAGIFLGATGTGLEYIGLTFFVADAYGAAVFGRLKSLPLTFVGALLLGLNKFYGQISIPETQVWQKVNLAIPGLFLFVVLLLLPEEKLKVGRIVGVKAPAIPGLRSSVVRAGVFVAAIWVLAQVGPSRYLPDMSRGLIYGVLLLSLVVLTGFSGQVSLCQYVFLALGAWAMGSYFGGNGILGMLLAGLVAVPVGVVVALPALRLQGLYLALVTFAFAAIAGDLVLQHPFIYGDGNVEVGRLALLGIDFESSEMFMVLCAVVFAAIGIGVLWLKRGPFGRRLAAMRDSEAACATLGLDLRRTKLAVYAVSAFIAGVAGSLFGGLAGTAGTVQFEKINNIVLFLFAMVGGITTVTGALIGGALFAVLPLVQSQFPEQKQLQGLVFAAVAAAAIALGRQPNGIAGLLFGRVAAWRQTLAGGDNRPAASTSASAPAVPAAPSPSPSTNGHAPAKEPAGVA